MNDDRVIECYRYTDIYPLHKDGYYIDSKNFYHVSCSNCLFKILYNIFMILINIDKY